MVTKSEYCYLFSLLLMWQNNSPPIISFHCRQIDYCDGQRKLFRYILSLLVVMPQYLVTTFFCCLSDFIAAVGEIDKVNFVNVSSSEGSTGNKDTLTSDQCIKEHLEWVYFFLHCSNFYFLFYKRMVPFRIYEFSLVLFVKLVSFLSQYLHYGWRI